MNKLRERAQKLKTDIPAVYLALRCKDTPATAKIFAFITVAYALSPIDLVPDFIPVLGYLDDILILPLLVTLTLRLIPKDILDRCRYESENMWSGGKPEKWYYALPIVFVWIIAAVVIIKIIWFR